MCSIWLLKKMKVPTKTADLSGISSDAVVALLSWGNQNPPNWV